MIRILLFSLLFISLSNGSLNAETLPDDNWLSLAGTWRFALDSNNDGIKDKWFAKSLDDSVHLPGTTDENHKGKLNNAREKDRLTRVYTFAGSAWYQQDINIPAQWSNKRNTLFLERTKNSRVWIDDDGLGSQDSLVAPHVYSLGLLTPGTHRLTIRINNSQYPRIGDPHQISDQTQTNWNGIIGKIGLLASDPIYINDVQIFSNIASKTLKVRIEVVNKSGLLLNSELTLNALNMDGNVQGKPVSIAFPAGDKPAVIEVNYPLDDTVQFWDEFTPVLYKLVVSLASSSDKKYADKKEISFGLRDFKAKGTQFNINGKTIFLRGKHDGCVFPLTGYPPMTVDGWLKVFNIAKSYGINHYRFHTWCPPEAAFEAADRLGIYLQTELPNWADFGEPNHDNFCMEEGKRLLKTFGNHPSFVMLALGNELGGKQELMAPFVREFRLTDPRHLYAQGTNNWFGMVDPNDDFWVSWQIQWQKRIRGSYGACDIPLGHVQIGPANTLKDYSTEITGIRVPVVSQEIGEYQVYPNFNEIQKYTGVLQARNFEIFRERLDKNGMLSQADDFFRASGVLSVLCYKEDIEAALRTKGFGGFQLLDLQDFPGQGTALVGILDAFMDSKGLIEPVQWRQFCSQTVPLVRMNKYTWTNNEIFTAETQIAHFGPSDMNNAVAVWTFQNSKGETLASGRLASQNIPQGTLKALGDISIPLKDIDAPAKIKLSLSIDGTNYINSYNLWVYPDNADISSANVVIMRKNDDAVKEALSEGKSVLLIPEANDLKNSIEGTFASDFWNYEMFKKLAQQRKMSSPAGTLGILCDPNHPALAGFPTEFHSNWQWFNLLRNSRTIILDEMPKDYRPVVQVIDNCQRANKLGNIFEVKIGKGKLLVCSINLLALKDKPEARQLLSSLLRYMNSDKFSPQTSIDQTTLSRILQ